ncbi:MAG: TPM domain-containing protein, partial [Bacteroidota bacterium]
MKKLLLLPALLLASTAWSQHAIPSHEGRWVHDEAGVLSAGTVSSLESILKAERDSTSNQIAVLIIKSLEGDEISSFANRVFREWKLGQEKKDNGVLFVVAIDDRKVRIEVGYGLEGNLTDLISSRIIRNEVAPHFRRGDYENGIAAGTMAIVQAISGTYKNTDRSTGGKVSGGGIGRILMLLLIIFIFSRRGRSGGSHWRGGSGWMGPMGGFGGSSGSWGGGGGGG